MVWAQSRLEWSDCGADPTSEWFEPRRRADRPHTQAEEHCSRVVAATLGDGRSGSRRHGCQWQSSPGSRTQWQPDAVAAGRSACQATTHVVIGVEFTYCIIHKVRNQVSRLLEIIIELR